MGRSRVFRRTSGRVLNAIFNIIGQRINGASFLDLYAGVGTVGIEALHRGASRVVFVEDNRQRCMKIRECLRRQGLEDRGRLYCMDVYHYLKRTEETFEIVFADPPYESEELRRISPFLQRLISQEGLIIIEHSSRMPMTSPPPGLELLRDYIYGDTTLTLFRKV